MDALIERCLKEDTTFTQHELETLVDKYKWKTEFKEEISPTLIEENIVIKYNDDYFSIGITIHDGKATLYQPVRRYYGK